MKVDSRGRLGLHKPDAAATEPNIARESLRLVSQHSGAESLDVEPARMISLRSGHCSDTDLRRCCSRARRNPSATPC